MDKDNHDFGSRVRCFTLIVSGIERNGKLDNGFVNNVWLSGFHSRVGFRIGGP